MENPEPTPVSPVDKEVTDETVIDNPDTRQDESSVAEDAENTLQESGATVETICVKIKELSDKDPADYTGEEVRRLKQHFLTLRKAAVAKALEEWTAAGNAPEDFVDADAQLEADTLQIIIELKEKKNAWSEKIEAEKAENLERKNRIIDEILALAADTDNVNRTFQQYRDLQEQFNAIGPVPGPEETGIWKRFSDAREKYSDNLKINKELRDYDFKRNLDLKELLISEARKLISEEDVIIAYRRLQELHNKWRQIGPVAKEIREEIWEKFKSLSTEINKRHQAHFEERKARETANEQGKIAICERVEALDFSNLKTFAEWDTMTKQIMDAQEEWKQFGFASKKANNALFARFRAVCDNFFTAKANFYKQVRDNMSQNLTIKTELCEKAEALKDSTDWNKTSEQIMELQKQWKSVGAVPKKHSDPIWKRFQAACDYFFDQRKKIGNSVRKVELENLKLKREIIESLGTITPEMPKDEVVAMIRDSQTKWQAVGHVPFREKDKIYEAYRAKLNDIREMFDLRESKARMERFNASVAEMEGDQQKLYRERERLIRVIDAKRLELRTLENNLGFLSSKSKSGDSMLKDFNRKIERLKAEITEVEEKVKLLDSKI